MKIEWKTCFKIGISVFLLFLCIYYWEGFVWLVSTVLGACYPIFAGFAAAYILNLLMSRYEKIYFPKSNKKFITKSRRAVCIILSFVTLLGVISLVIGLVLPQLMSCIKLIIEIAPAAIRNTIFALDKYNILSEDMVSILNSVDWMSGVNQFMEVLTTGVGSVMGAVIGTVTTVFSGIVTAFLCIIFAVYILADKERLCSQANRITSHYLPSTLYKKLRYALGVLNDCFRKYIVGQCTEAVILGLLCTLGMAILRLPYATMIGALVAFTALIPIAGAYIGAGVGAFMILTVSPVKALVFLAFILILQQLEGNLIYPRVVGSSMGLPSIWVLAAVTIGGGMLGVTGMLFGVPLAAAIYRMVRHNMNKNMKGAANEKLSQENS